MTSEYEAQNESLRMFAQVLKDGGAIVMHPRTYETLKRVAGKAGPNVQAVHYLVANGVPVIVTPLAGDDILAMTPDALAQGLLRPDHYERALRYLED